MGRSTRQARLRVGVEIPAGWSGCDPVWPLVERTRAEGAVFLLKLDGERTEPDDNGPYTVMVSGGLLKEDDWIRGDFHSLEAGLASVLLGYAERCWGFPEEG